MAEEWSGGCECDGNLIGNRRMDAVLSPVVPLLDHDGLSAIRAFPGIITEQTVDSFLQ